MVHPRTKTPQRTILTPRLGGVVRGLNECIGVFAKLPSTTLTTAKVVHIAAEERAIKMNEDQGQAAYGEFRSDYVGAALPSLSHG
ncbi:unnamed protein product [Ectocarpus sp. CCAP 1310/34]|nr:unnamed protein product [Ectocarpus sp. CCAP 1310/34]